MSAAGSPAELYAATLPFVAPALSATAAVSSGLLVSAVVALVGRALSARHSLKAASAAVRKVSGQTQDGDTGANARIPWLPQAVEHVIEWRIPVVAQQMAAYLGGQITRDAEAAIAEEPGGRDVIQHQRNVAGVLVVGITAFGAMAAATLGLLAESGAAACAALTALAAAVGARAPSVLAKRWFTRRSEAVTAELPALIDTVSLCARTGMSFDQALELYCSRFNTLLGALLGESLKVWRSGMSTRRRELDRLSLRVGSPVVEGFLSAVTQSIEFGTPIAATLDAQAAEVRERRRAAIEEHIAKLPVKMLVPIGVFTLPAMLILLLAPVAMQVFSGLG